MPSGKRSSHSLVSAVSRKKRASPRKPGGPLEKALVLSMRTATTAMIIVDCFMVVVAFDSSMQRTME